MMSPLVSVIIVNYNYGRFLDECLTSVTQQTYPRIECIVVDNNSSDNSVEVFSHFVASNPEKCPQRTFTLQKMPENLRHLGAAINGFRHSSGEFVVFLDADDYLCPTFVEAHIWAHLTVRSRVGASSVDMYQSTPEGIVATTTASFSNYVLSGRGRTRDFTRELSSDSWRTIIGDSRDQPIEESKLHHVDRETSSEWVWSPTSSLCFRRDAVELMFRNEPKLWACSLDAFLLRGTGSLMGSLLIDSPLAVYRHHGANVFGKRPALANFRSFDYNQLRKEDHEIADAVIKSYLQNRDFLASSLEHHSYFIKAVNTIANSGIEPLNSRFPSFMSEFIETNREELEKSFGFYALEEWSSWYGPKFSTVRSRLMIFKAVLKR
jgi:glycosyltransferase involved in cell wall biosynthesis